jgi:glycoside/pentoside/hexuronide:cation symporter, GPH family
MSAPAPVQRLSVGEKLGYALGDAATNFFFMTMILYQSRFYTDVVGISAAAIGWLFLAVRWIDAIADPVIGALADRTNTRWGKFRPWVLWTAVPYGVIFWLSFSVPDIGSTGKLVYVAITYLLLMVVYSANNTPYSALTGVMTADPSERTSISTYRLFLATVVGQILVQGLALPMVDKFGQGDAAKGWSVTIGIFGALIIIFNLITFATTKERVQPDVRQKSSVKQDLKDVFTCRPWLALFVLTLMIFTMIVLRGSAFNFYFGYYLDPIAVRDFLASFGMGASDNKFLNAMGLVLKADASNATNVAFGFFNIITNLAQIIGILSSKALSDRFGKRNVYAFFLTMTAIVTVIPIFLTPQSIGGVFLVAILWGLAYGPTVPLLWAMIADVPDFLEWKTGRRATGFAYAGVVFALKAGLGVGGALIGWLLAGYGYVPNVAQTEHALNGIRLSASVYSAIPCIIGIVALLMYPITKDLSLRIRDGLAERRQKSSAT